MAITDWFREPGAYVLVDGQFGSTGKGLMAGVIGEIAGDRITHYTTNAGPNSGHTAYLKQPSSPNGELRIMTQQLPVAAVVAKALGYDPLVYLNAGAIIDPEILLDESLNYKMDMTRVLIHPNAALIRPLNKALDATTTVLIAGTGKGIGPAMSDKLMRQQGQNPIASSVYMPILPDSLGMEGFPHQSWDHFWDWDRNVVFVETAQGFSLGLNQARFYPQVTSRECTVGQALSDARIPAGRLQRVLMTLRTFPIRVGNTENSSGECYPDQQETTWEAIGQEPELTTVTKRVRRVFTWSRVQFREAVAANEPDILFLNFANYLSKVALVELIDTMQKDYVAMMNRPWEQLLVGFGPRSSDVVDGRYPQHF